MSKVLALCLLCLLPALAHAQPSFLDIYQSQREVAERMLPLAWVRSTSITSYDKNGQPRTGTAYVRRCVMRDDGTLHADPVQPTLALYGLTLTRLDADALFRPIFVTTASKVRYERLDGALYLFRVERLNGLAGFEGRVWVTGSGFIVKAVGRHVPGDLKEGEVPLRFVYTAQAGTYLPAELVEDDTVGGRRVKIVSTFTGYLRFKAEEPREIEMGDEP